MGSPNNKSKNIDINELLARHAKNVTQFIASPETIEQMQKEGLKLDKREPITNERYVDQLFAGRKEQAYELIKQFPDPPNIALPPILSLYDEIRECILFGLNGAAITLSAVLIEFALKHAIVDKTKGIEVFDGKEWDRIEAMELGPAIKEAETLKLLNKSGIEKLIKFKNNYRNPYLHYNIKKIVTGYVMPKAGAYDMNTKTVTTKYNLKAEETPILWQSAKKDADARKVMEVFLFADSVVKRLFNG